MTWRRSATICLLVFCLPVGAILHFASQVYPDAADGQVSQPEISAPEAGPALALGNKIETPSGPELTPAVLSRLNFLLLLSENGELCRLTDDRFRSGPVASAIEIRGPPGPVAG